MPKPTHTHSEQIKINILRKINKSQTQPKLILNVSQGYPKNPISNTLAQTQLKHIQNKPQTPSILQTHVQFYLIYLKLKINLKNKNPPNLPPNLSQPYTKLISNKSYLKLTHPRHLNKNTLNSQYFPDPFIPTDCFLLHM